MTRITNLPQMEDWKAFNVALYFGFKETLPLSPTVEKVGYKHRTRCGLHYQARHWTNGHLHAFLTYQTVRSDSPRFESNYLRSNTAALLSRVNTPDLEVMVER